ncbi:MAG: exonuclease domain-containing protein [Acidimicrobiales bacterium]
MTEYVGFDLETTGVSSFLDVPVSYGFVQHVRDQKGTSTLVDGGYVNPGVAIPAGASAIHGITNDMVAGATVLDDAVEIIVTKLVSVWASGSVVVGMNVGYDLTMVESLCRRLEIPTLEERGTIGGVMDILVLDRHFDKWRKGARKLTDLCGHYGVTLESAHSAAADAEASLLVFEAMVANFPEIEGIPAVEINTTLRSWYQEWLSSFSSYLEKKGEAPIGAGRYEWPIHLDL